MSGLCAGTFNVRAYCSSAKRENLRWLHFLITHHKKFTRTPTLQHQHSNTNTQTPTHKQVRQAIHHQQRKRRMIEEQRRKPKKRKLTKEEKEKRRKRMANVIHSLTKDQLKSLFGSLRTEFNPFWNAQRMKTHSSL